eukprot:GEMP01081470.1.p2 GENE.GEMP01081470.1~~GEMP01081470.1.p2  ORF type:complete len:109 (+),score=5.29 GEMP01081470.1:548-874(+)
MHQQIVYIGKTPALMVTFRDVASAFLEHFLPPPQSAERTHAKIERVTETRSLMATKCTPNIVYAAKIEALMSTLRGIIRTCSKHLMALYCGIKQKNTMCNAVMMRRGQ